MNLRRLIRFVLVTLGVLVLWTAVGGIGFLEGWWRSRLATRGNPDAFMNALVREVQTAGAGNVGLVLIQDRSSHAEHMSSVVESVDRDTVFQVASLSKWVTAWGVMTLVEQGRLDLDAPVSRYLTRWALPETGFDNNGVTIRRLLSHTAGLTDGLGYGGFRPGSPVQTLEASLTQAADASPGANGRVQVGHPPGERFKYSGGGYTLLQLLIEEVSGVPFEAYMQRAVFEPLGMEHSTFVWDDTRGFKLAPSFGVDSTPTAYLSFTSLAATSLYTTVGDMTTFVQAHLPGDREEPVGRGVLTAATLERMREPHASQLGQEIWGLGTMLYAPSGAGGFVVGHDGNNEPAINTAVRFNPATGNGIVILETGSRLLATRLAGEWVFWETGNLDFLTVTMEAERMFTVIAVGWMAIVVGALVVAWRGRPAARAS
jgi:CubicO group peptidase (beta-lactamase class C family)